MKHGPYAGIKSEIKLVQVTGRLSNAEVGRMVREAEKYRVADDKNRKKIIAMNALQADANNVKKGVRPTPSTWELESAIPSMPVSLL